MKDARSVLEYHCPDCKKPLLQVGLSGSEDATVHFDLTPEAELYLRCPVCQEMRRYGILITPMSPKS